MKGISKKSIDLQNISKFYNQMEKDSFKHCFNGKTRITPGIFQFMAILVPERVKKRPLPPVPETLALTFDNAKFNFNKIRPKEVIGVFRDSNLDLNDFNSELKGHKINKRPKNSVKNDEEGKNATHLVIVNSIPCTPLHALLIPFSKDSLPQVLSKTSLKTAFRFALSGENLDPPVIRVGFNSLGGHSSVNHLHFHVFSPSLETTWLLPIERVSLPKGRYYELCDEYFIELTSAKDENLFPARFFALSANSISPEANILNQPFILDQTAETLSSMAEKIIKRTIEKGFAYNLIISSTPGSISALTSAPTEKKKKRKIVTLFVFPRKRVAKYAADEITVACLEFSGLFCVKKYSDFATLNEQKLAGLLLEQSLKKEDFESLESDILKSL